MPIYRGGAKTVISVSSSAPAKPAALKPHIGETLEQHGLYYGIYRGIIKKYDEKNLQLGIEIPSLGLEVSIGIDYYYNFAFPFASGVAGLHFDPKVGDGVYIAFENGCVAYPIILGYFHKANELSGLGNKFDEGDLGRRVLQFKTRSGHEVNFIDEKDKESIEISNHDKSVKVLIQKKKIAITIGEARIYVDEKGNVEIKGKKIKLHNGGTVEPSVLGEQLKNFLAKLLDILTKHTHAPNSPPAQAGEFLRFKMELDKLLSKINEIE